MNQSEAPVIFDINISANLNREDRAYIEKIDAQLLALLKGKHVREVKDVKILEQVLALVKARGAFLRGNAQERRQLMVFPEVQKTVDWWIDVYGQQAMLQEMSDGSFGFRDEQGIEYPFPRAEDISAWMLRHAGDVEQLQNEQMDELIIVPIMGENPALRMIDCFSHILEDEAVFGRLTDASEKLIELSDNFLHDLQAAIVRDARYVRYFPSYSKRHSNPGNKNSYLIDLQRAAGNPFAGYMVSFVESRSFSLEHISSPQDFRKKLPKKRCPISTYFTCLNDVNTDPSQQLNDADYRFMTIEEWCAKGIKVAREQHQVLDANDAGGVKGLGSFLLGSSISDSPGIEYPNVYWDCSRNIMRVNTVSVSDDYTRSIPRVAVGLDGIEGSSRRSLKKKI